MKVKRCLYLALNVVMLAIAAFGEDEKWSMSFGLVKSVNYAALSDVQTNGVSAVKDGVANIQLKAEEDPVWVANSNGVVTALRSEIAAHAPGNYATVSNNAMTAVQPSALDNYLPATWATDTSSLFYGSLCYLMPGYEVVDRFTVYNEQWGVMPQGDETRFKPIAYQSDLEGRLPATHDETAGWMFADANPLSIGASLSVFGDFLWIQQGWNNLKAGENYQTLIEYLNNEAMVNKALSLQMMENGPCLEWDMTTERWGFSWPSQSVPFSPFAFVSEVEAHAPGNYAAVSNAAMTAVMSAETNLAQKAVADYENVSADSVVGKISNTRVAMRVEGTQLQIRDGDTTIWTSSSGGGKTLDGQEFDFKSGVNMHAVVYQVLTNVIQQLGGTVKNPINLQN